jgi:acyl dehydratase
VRLDDLDVGDEIPPRDRRVTREDVATYAHVGGDRNPLHLDDAVARAAGFDGVIAHGMFTMGHLAQTVVDWLGEGPWMERFRVQFRAPVRIGESIVAGGRVSSVDRSERRASLEVWVTVERDGAVAYPIRRGVADVRFP